MGALNMERMQHIQLIQGNFRSETDRSQTVKLLQIVGFKNSGKTTLAERLLRLAAGRGLKTAAVKHHGHGGMPELPSPGTDGVRLFEAGADCSLVSGGGVVLLQSRTLADKPDDKPDDRSAGKSGSSCLDSLVRLAAFCAEPDLIVVEGFKEAEYDKIALVHTEEDWTSLRKLANVRLVLVRDGELAERLLARAGELDEHLPAREREGALGERPLAWFGGIRHGQNDWQNIPISRDSQSDLSDLRADLRADLSCNCNVPGAIIPLLIREDNESIAAWFAEWLKEDTDGPAKRRR